MSSVLACRHRLPSPEMAGCLTWDALRAQAKRYPHLRPCPRCKGARLVAMDRPGALRGVSGGRGKGTGMNTDEIRGGTMSEQKYGKRTCLQCGQTFEAIHPAHITCSAKCALERRRGQKRRTDARARARRKNYLLGLLASLDEAWSELECLNCRHEAQRGKDGMLLAAMCAAHAAELERLREELGRARLELASRKAELDAAREELEALRGTREKVAIKPASQAPRVDTSNWDYCKRMSLRAKRLPCGEREECEGCEKVRPLVLEPGDKVCPKCKQVFTPKAPSQKYCSKQCQEDAARAKWKK